MRHDDLSHWQKWPLVPQLYANGVLRLITGNCHFSCGVVALQRRWSILSVGRRPGQGWCGRQAAAHAAGSPLHVADVEQGKGGLVPVPTQELSERWWRQRRTALGTPTPDFSSGLLPNPFSRSSTAARQRGFGVRVFLLLAGLPSKADGLHLPGFVVTAFHSHVIRWSSARYFVLFTRNAQRKTPPSATQGGASTSCTNSARSLVLWYC